MVDQAWTVVNIVWLICGGAFVVCATIRLCWEMWRPPSNADRLYKIEKITAPAPWPRPAVRKEIVRAEGGGK